MYVGLSKEQEALRDELRAYYDGLLTPEVEDDLRKGEGVGQVSKDVWKQMCKDGWAGVGWPKEWGGRGMTPIEQFVFFDESMRAGAPVPMLTINSVAPTIMRYGSEEQKQFYVDKILKGEIHFAIGYTEPDAGTDLASLKTKAVRDGDEYIINGQKVFTSLASGSDYIWLAVRTSTEAKKHKGISIIIVPTDTPGFSYKKIDNFGDTNTNITYYEDVRVPAGNLVGEENQGWSLITNQLNHERVTLCSSGIVERQLDDVRNWAQDDEAGRRPARHRPGVGAGQPRTRARQARVPQARELEDRVACAAGRVAEPGRRVRDQGVRHRVLHGSRAAAHGSHARPGAAVGKVAGCGRARPGRAHGPRRCTSSRSVAAPTRCNAT